MFGEVLSLPIVQYFSMGNSLPRSFIFQFIEINRGGQSEFCARIRTVEPLSVRIAVTPTCKLDISQDSLNIWIFRIRDLWDFSIFPKNLNCGHYCTAVKVK
jgi:hypothetical protein